MHPPRSATRPSGDGGGHHPTAGQSIWDGVAAETNHNRAVSQRTAPCQACWTATDDRPRWGVAVLCDDCLEAARAPIRARVIERQGDVDRVPAPIPANGQMRQVGPLRPDYGLGWAECACRVCDGEAVAVIGSACGWCAATVEFLERKAS